MHFRENSYQASQGNPKEEMNCPGLIDISDAYDMISANATEKLQKLRLITKPELQNTMQLVCQLLWFSSIHAKL
jgi:hypothetical protein